MISYRLFINNEWTDSVSGRFIEVEDPAAREITGTVPRGSEEDVDAAVRAAKAAYGSWSALGPSGRAACLRRLADVIGSRSDEFCSIITSEIGVPVRHAYDTHVSGAAYGAADYADIAESYGYVKEHEGYVVVREPYGVVAGITPWNYPLIQAATKVFAAMAAGNTVVLKPSRQAPLSCMKLAECVLEAGFPEGVFNVVTGVGGEVGNALAVHPDVDAVSFTGSTKGGIEVGRLALGTVKKITLELGGKSPLILLPDGDAEAAVKTICEDVYANCGQKCCAYTRMLVPEDRKEEAERLLKAEAAKYVTGDPRDENTMMGPLVSASAYDKVRSYIKTGIDEGARLICGKVPEELTERTPGYFVEPAVFTDVKNDMLIAREEIFGPVISVITYQDIDDAVRIANDTKYGLAGAVFGSERAMEVLGDLKAGYLSLNGAVPAGSAPFGGYRMSGTGREEGVFGFEEFLQIKTIAK